MITERIRSLTLGALLALAAMTLSAQPARAQGFAADQAEEVEYRAEGPRYGDVSMRLSRPIEGGTCRLDGFKPGRYRVEFWDCWAGVAFEHSTADSTDGTLELQVPPFERDIACKVRLLRR